MFGTVQILMLAVGILFILILWMIVGVRHLNNLKHGVFGQWELVDERLRKRQDVLPLLIEITRRHVKKEDLMDKLIEERLKAAKEYFPGAKKIEFEFDLSKRIDEVLALSGEEKNLAKDTNFLEIRKEINDLEEEIDARSKKYNEMVRYYNKHRNFIFVRPLAAIFAFKNFNIFDFEV